MTQLELIEANQSSRVNETEMGGVRGQHSMPVKAYRPTLLINQRSCYLYAQIKQQRSKVASKASVLAPFKEKKQSRLVQKNMLGVGVSEQR